MGDHAACAGLAVGDAVEIGDEIVLDMAARTLDLVVDPAELARELAGRFRSRYGRDPAGVWAARGG